MPVVTQRIAVEPHFIPLGGCSAAHEDRTCRDDGFRERAEFQCAVTSRTITRRKLPPWTTVRPPPRPRPPTLRLPRLRLATLRPPRLLPRRCPPPTHRRSRTTRAGARSS